MTLNRNEHQKMTNKLKEAASKVYLRRGNKHYCENQLHFVHFSSTIMGIVDTTFFFQNSGNYEYSIFLLRESSTLLYAV